MAFWKTKFFKSGSSKKSNEHKDDDEAKYQSRRSGEDSPNSINSLEEAYANLPLVKKPEVAKRQMLPDQERSLTMEEAQRQQSMTIDENHRQTSMTIEEAQRTRIMHNDVNSIQAPFGQPQVVKNEKIKSKVAKQPQDQANKYDINVVLPTWRNENLSNNIPPTSTISPNMNGEANVYSPPSWSATISKDGQADTSPPRSVRNRGSLDKDEKIYVSSVSIPQHQQQVAPCFVVNNPCMLTGSYPCYVMNVPQSTPYVPVQIYPMMLVPNQQSKNRVSNRMVY